MNDITAEMNDSVYLFLSLLCLQQLFNSSVDRHKAGWKILQFTAGHRVVVRLVHLSRG